MPSIRPEEIRRLASLARIRVEPGEIDELAREIGEILGHLEALRKLEGEAAAEAEPSAEMHEGTSPLRFRDDVPNGDPLLRPPTEAAPTARDGFFLVPHPPGLDENGGDEGDEGGER